MISRWKQGVRELPSSSLLYFIGLVIWQVSSVMNMTILGKVGISTRLATLPIRGLGLMLIMLSFVLGLRAINYSIPLKWLLWVGCIGIFLVINNVLLGHNTSYIDIIIIVVCGAYVDLDKLIYPYFLVRIISVLTIIIAMLVGLLPSTSSYRDGLVRYDLGFYWSSFVPFIFLFCLLYLMWDLNRKPTIPIIICFVAINQLLFYLTDTKWPYYLTLLALIIWWVETHLINMDSVSTTRFCKIMANILLPLLIFLIYYLSVNYTSFPQLNNMLSGRLSLGYQGIQRFGIGLFGHKYVDYTNLLTAGEYFTIDSGLLRYLVNFGLISTLLVGILFRQFLYSLINNKMAKRAVVIFIVFLTGFTDPWILRLDANIFLTWMASFSLKALKARQDL